MQVRDAIDPLHEFADSEVHAMMEHVGFGSGGEGAQGFVTLNSCVSFALSV